MNPIVEKKKDGSGWKIRHSGQLRFKFFVTGVMFPIVCLVMGGTKLAIPTMDEPWQSGRVSDYVAMLFGWPGFAPFLPFIALSSISMVVWTVKQETEDYLIVRLGIFSGALLSFQFLVLSLVTSGFATFLIAPVFGGGLAVIALLGQKLIESCCRSAFTIRKLMVLTAVIAVSLGVIQATMGWVEFGEQVFGFLYFVCGATPLLSFLTYVRASCRIGRLAGFGFTSGMKLPALGWVVLWIVSWKYAIEIMLDEYSKLPTTNPNCFVSGVAAKGHRCLVGSVDVRGDGVNVNGQIRRLKFLEFSIAAAFPHLHAFLRRWYNWFGPILARVCGRSVWFADASYLLLKPLELVAEVVRRMASISNSRISKIYSEKQSVLKLPNGK